MHQPLKFIYFGTPEVAAGTLEALLAAGFAPTLVVTNPDARSGRGLVVAPSPVKALAVARGLAVATPEKLDDAFVETTKAHGCSLAVVVAYGKIFPEALIDAFPQGVINVHYSLLPKYRGATPMEAALLAGDAVTGVTIQKMALEMDAGDVVAQIETPIKPLETARELRPRLIELGARLLVETLPRYAAGEIKPTPQDAARATRARKLQKEDGLLDLAADAHENWNKYRAYADTIGTYFMYDGKRVKIVEAKFENAKFVPLQITPEGRRTMSYADFARG